MSEFEPTSPHESIPGPEWSGSAPIAKQTALQRARRSLAHRKSRWIMAATAMAAAIGLSVSLATAPSTTAVRLPPATTIVGGSGSGGGASNVGAGPLSGGGSNARSGPAAGGASGTVSNVSTSGFTMTTSAGQQVTVNEASSTTYKKGTSSPSASAITKGEPVLALGTDNGTTITATQVIVTPPGGSTSSSAAKVVPFTRGAPTTSKQLGQIPASFSQGSGTIVSGTAANKATEAALAAYPGGIVDRVVRLSNGEYNVHFIGVNWPHHVFVTKSFKVVGAL